MITLEEFQGICTSEHLIVLDTNTLLELYRKPSNISMDIIKAFKQIIDRIYVPRQVYDEYLKNYHKVSGNEKSKYKNVHSELSQIIICLQENIASRITEYRKHNYTDISKLQSDLDGKIKDIKNIVKEFENNHKQESERNLDFILNDKVKEFVDLLVERGNVGTAIPFSERMLILQEGKVRFENLIPPGYEDNEKVGADRYGDLFIWKNIIEVAKEKNANILFVCNDVKGDWWEKEKKCPIDLRKELLEEFKESNPLLEIHFLNMDKFFSYLAEELKIGQSKSALQLSAIDYVEKNLDQYDDMIESEIVNFATTININEILGGEFLPDSETEKVYWSIKDVSVDKQDKDIFYYIELDVSILADLVYIGNEEYPKDARKLAIALDGKIKLTTEEYSKTNVLESIDINIIEAYCVEPEIWRAITKDNDDRSSREIIRASKRLTKYSNSINGFENIYEVGKVLEGYIKAYNEAIKPFSNYDELVEALEPLRTASRKLKSFEIPEKVKAALKPLEEINTLIKATNIDTKVLGETSLFSDNDNTGKNEGSRTED